MVFGPIFCLLIAIVDRLRHGTNYNTVSCGCAVNAKMAHVGLGESTHTPTRVAVIL